MIINKGTDINLVLVFMVKVYPNYGIQQYKNVSIKITHRSKIKEQILHIKKLETEEKILFKVKIRKPTY